MDKYIQEVQITKIVTYTTTVVVEYLNEDDDIDELAMQEIDVNGVYWDKIDEEYETYHI